MRTFISIFMILWFFVPAGMVFAGKRRSLFRLRR